MNDYLITECTASTLSEVIDRYDSAPVLIITDGNVERFCLSRLGLPDVIPVLVLGPGEQNKNIGSVEKIWESLHQLGASRNSTVLNVGGGMVTDVGGFACATFKRGVRFINVATSLLAALDASIGGKTAINFRGVKNEIGVFAWPVTTVIGLDLMKSLSRSEYLSGYGEMLKTGFIAGESLLEKVMMPDVALGEKRGSELSTLIKDCIEVKRRIVERDPKERGERKVLNLGHTVGHTFEALAMERCGKGGEAMPHGVAVGYGLLTALILSHLRMGFPATRISRYARLLKDYFPAINFSCKDYPRLLEFMHADKKNEAGGPVLFTLLRNVGEPEWNIPVTDEEIRTALDITRDYIGQ